MRRAHLGMLLMAVVLCVVAYAWSSYPRCGIPSGQDHREAAELANALLDEPSLQALWSVHIDAVSCAGRWGRTELLVYGVFTPEEQKTICEVVARLRVTRTTKPIELRFYPQAHSRENLTRLEIYP